MLVTITAEGLQANVSPDALYAIFVIRPTDSNEKIFLQFVGPNLLLKCINGNWFEFQANLLD